uniref:Uncharacterized protein n=1 Tax=Molossus molossus TaxID=27622 RepID=A0A7J8CRS3_MOLMO|nr:hypothetical protein HJG59_009727 [Molossus molossus]
MPNNPPTFCSREKTRGQQTTADPQPPRGRRPQRDVEAPPQNTRALHKARRRGRCLPERLPCTGSGDQGLTAAEADCREECSSLDQSGEAGQKWTEWHLINFPNWPDYVEKTQPPEQKGIYLKGRTQDVREGLPGEGFISKVG